MKNSLKFCIALACVMVLSFNASAGLQTLQQGWAKANYALQGEAQLALFEQLINEAEAATQSNPKDAALWVWSGIIKSTYAGAKGGLGALKLAKAAKADLEQAMAIEATVLDGSAYTSLGTLYLNVPGWPIGFGNKNKAKKMLLKALEINPNGIDSNYFYADFLRQTKQPAQAKRYYQKALAAAPRVGRPLADSGRRTEIEAALAGL